LVSAFTSPVDFFGVISKLLGVGMPPANPGNGVQQDDAHEELFSFEHGGHLLAAPLWCGGPSQVTSLILFSQDRNCTWKLGAYDCQPTA